MPLNDALVDSLDAKAESLAHRPVTKTATGLMMEKPGLFHIQPKANRMFATTVEATVANEQPQLEIPNSPNPAGACCSASSPHSGTCTTNSQART